MGINRSAIVVKPLQPYVDWANSCDQYPTKTTLDYARQDCSTYLVPCWDDDADLDRILKRVCRRIFENELAGWTVDEATWPKRRGFATFQKWFDVEAHSMVFELGDGFIEVEGE